MASNPFRRAVRVPAEVLDRVSLAKGEKVLAAALARTRGVKDDEGAPREATWVLGTRDALLIVEMGPVPVEMGPVRDELARVPWQRIETAEWDQDTERLVVVEVGEFAQVRPSYSFEIGDPGLMLELIRERVTASVVLQRRVVITGKRGLYVVARRAPRGLGEITWAYQFDAGVDAEDPEVMQLAQRGLRAAAEELGL